MPLDRGDQRWPPPLSETAPDYQPSVHRPLVYYLFGTLAQPFSLVLKEDDYFDYLVGVTALKRQVPSAVRFALTESALLFLGFQLDDWGFRVLFRNILGQGATARREQHPHVAVQLDPDSPEQPSSVRRYLQNYFASADVTVYWGRVEQFLQEFAANWARYQTEEGTG